MPVTGQHTEKRILQRFMRYGSIPRPRVPSPRQLPTDHDCAVPTRGYQSDQPSHLPLGLSPALLPSSVARRHQNQNTTGLNLDLTGSPHIRTPAAA